MPNNAIMHNYNTKKITKNITAGFVFSKCCWGNKQFYFVWPQEKQQQEQHHQLSTTHLAMSVVSSPPVSLSYEKVQYPIKANFEIEQPFNE